MDALLKLKRIFQKDIKELIEWFIIDSEKKITALEFAIRHNNQKQMLTVLRELRAQSNEIGAISFGYLCLNIELRIAEYQVHQTDKLFERLKRAYAQLKDEALKIYAELTSKSNLKTLT
ncbi:MAG: hypothetical protein U1E78_05745 [Gammaproteobacteria bacterium]